MSTTGAIPRPAFGNAKVANGEIMEEKLMPSHQTPDECFQSRSNEENGSLCCPSFLSCFLSTACPCCWCCACETVTEKTDLVLLNYGKHFATLRSPGLYLVNPCGLTRRAVQTSRVSLNLDNVKVADGKGNPLVLSGVVTYQVANSKKAALDVSDLANYIMNQGLTVMKKVASMYPYESADGHSLKSEAERIRTDMIHMLQERCDVAGVVIYNFELTDLAYAPEIAQAMLIRQQAEAMVDARKIIVKGAVEIAAGALDGLKEKGLQMAPEEQARMVTNLLVTICGDTKVQPTISLSSENAHHHH